MTSLFNAFYTERYPPTRVTKNSGQMRDAGREEEVNDLDHTSARLDESVLPFQRNLFPRTRRLFALEAQRGPSLMSRYLKKDDKTTDQTLLKPLYTIPSFKSPRIMGKARRANLPQKKVHLEVSLPLHTKKQPTRQPAGRAPLSLPLN